jgi:hypothetical protein
VIVGQQVAEGTAVDRGVTQHHVVGDPLAHQPQCLAQRVGQHACESGMGERPAYQGRDPQRLRRDPDRLAGRPAGEVGGVGVEGVEVDHHHRGRRVLQTRDRSVESSSQVVARDVAARGSGGHAGFRSRDA